MNHSKAEVARRQIDLAVISVLLDAGAGPGWSYADSKSGITFDRSEGLAVASLRLFESGLLSLNGWMTLEGGCASAKKYYTGNIGVTISSE